MEADESQATTEPKDNQLVVLVHSAHDLPDVDEGAYVKVAVKSGSKTQLLQSEQINSTSPEWNETFRFDSIKFESTEVLLYVKKRNVRHRHPSPPPYTLALAPPPPPSAAPTCFLIWQMFFRTSRMGQVDFALREQEIPLDGSLTPPKTFPLNSSSSNEACGSITIQLGWKRGGDVEMGIMESEELLDMREAAE